jgi:hypothetical protein
MATVCEIVYHKLGWLFGELEVRMDYGIVKEKIYSPLGIDFKPGISNSDIKRVASSISSLLPDGRIIALEYDDADGELRTMAWEEYRDTYCHDWVIEAIAKEPERKYHVYFKIDKKIT